MSWRRGIVVVGVVGAALLLSLTLFSQAKGHTGTGGVREAYFRGDLIQAHTLLDGIETRLSSAQARLLRSYILRDESDFERSDRQLVLALKATAEEAEQWEIHLGLALNAVMQGDHAHARNAWAAAQAIDPNHPHTQFLSGVIAFGERQYSAAAAILKESRDDVGMSWLGEAIRHHYSAGWRAEAQARCAIELGDPFRARRILERAGQTGTPSGAALAIYTFLRESDGVPLDQAIGTLRQAHAYLKGLPVQATNPQPLIAEAAWARINQLQTGVERATLIDATALLADLLRRWGAPSDLRSLSHSVFTKFVAQLSAETWASTASILCELQLATGAPFGAEAEEQLHASIWGDGIEQIPYLARIAERLQPHTTGESVLAGVQERIVGGIASDDQELTRTHNLLRIWNTLQPTPFIRQQFAFQLLEESTQLWDEPDQSPKGQLVTELVAKLPGPEGQKVTAERIVAALRNSYEQAHRANNLETLSLLHQTARQFGVEHLGPDREREAANQLADAIHYFEAGRDHEAKRRAKWVLQLDPQSSDAHRIIGLLLFGRGKKEKALRHLRFVLEPDPRAAEALGICELSYGQPEKGEALLQWLTRHSHPLTDEASLLLAYRALQAGLEREATTWAHRIGERNSEASALLALIAYQKGDPEKALDHLNHCHLQAFGLAALRGVCRAELGNSEEVDLALLIDPLPPPSRSPSY